MTNVRSSSLLRCATICTVICFALLSSANIYGASPHNSVSASVIPVAGGDTVIPVAGGDTNVIPVAGGDTNVIPVAGGCTFIPVADLL